MKFDLRSWFLHGAANTALFWLNRPSYDVPPKARRPGQQRSRFCGMEDTVGCLSQPFWPWQGGYGKKGPGSHSLPLQGDSYHC